MPSLGTALFAELSPKFFGLLSGANARIYLDVLDAVERAMPEQGSAMERPELLALIDRVLEQSSGLQEEQGEEGAQEQPSAAVFRRLLSAHWLEEEKRTDYRQIVYLEPLAQALIVTLRSALSQSVASFTGKLRVVCDQLAALREEKARRELIWRQLKEALAMVQAGLRELRMIRKQVERYAQRQLRTATISEALDIIYNEFSTLITQKCYREMIHARLPERLREAVEGLTALERDSEALDLLRSDFLRVEGSESGENVSVITRTIEALSVALGDVEPTADRVDTSAADFARRSRARIRYIQDVGSARRQQVKVIFDYVRDHLAEVRLADLEEKLELPDLYLTEMGLIGTGSLARRRERSAAGEAQQVVAPLSDEDREESLREMEKNVRNSLRLDRANRFIDQLELESGEKITSDHIPVRTEDDLLDVLSCLVFAPAGGASYRLQTQREVQPEAPIQMDEKGDFLIERFEVEKK